MANIPKVPVEEHIAADLDGALTQYFGGSFPNDPKRIFAAGAVFALDTADLYCGHPHMWPEGAATPIQAVTMYRDACSVFAQGKTRDTGTPT